MPRIKHISCPKCGGTIGVTNIDRITSCRYCTTPLLIEWPDMVPEYFYRPEISLLHGQSILRKLFHYTELPFGFRKGASFGAARLYFIPYHELSARRIGNIGGTIGSDQKDSSHNLFSNSDLDLKLGTWTSLREKNLLRMNRASKVILSNLETMIEPAVTLKGWNLDQVDLKNPQFVPVSSPLPLDRKHLKSMGTILSPDHKPESIFDHFPMLKDPAAGKSDHTSLADVRIKTIYYPVWRFQYQYKRSFYTAHLDAVTGKVMSAHAPRDDRYRLGWLLISTAYPALLLGWGCRYLLSQIHGNWSFSIVPFLVAFGAFWGTFAVLSLLLIIGTGWEELRYASELEFAGHSITRLKINRPSHTWVDSIRGIVDGFGEFSRPKSPFE